MGASQISTRRRQLLAVLLAAFGEVVEFASSPLALSWPQQQTPVHRSLPPSQLHNRLRPALPFGSTPPPAITTGPNSRHYGRTKRGKYMMEDDAIRAGFRPAQN